MGYYQAGDINECNKWQDWNQNTLDHLGIWINMDQIYPLSWGQLNHLGSKFRRNSGRNSGSGPFSGIFGPGVAGIIFFRYRFFPDFFN